MTIARNLCLAAAMLTVIGCGGGAKIAPVAGVITLGGKPLANAVVTFQPMATAGTAVAGAGSSGVTDASGSYALKMSDSDQAGAVVGLHRVEINLKAESDDRDPKLRPPPKVLPAKYNRNSELQFEVKPGGTTAANFDLK
jgi:hypothetical protein